jgi:hypothetical protein
MLALAVVFLAAFVGPRGTVLAPAPPGSDEPLPPLQELARFALPTPYHAWPGSRRHLAISADASVIYATSGRTLFVVDGADGEVLAAEPILAHRIPNDALIVRGGDTLLAFQYAQDRLLRFDLTDPRLPAALPDVLIPPEVYDIEISQDGSAVLLDSREFYWLTLAGNVRKAVPRPGGVPAWGSYALQPADGPPLLAVAGHGKLSLLDTAILQPRWVVDSTIAGRLHLDRAGTIVVGCSYDYGAVPRTCEVRDAADGSLRSTLALPPGTLQTTLAEGGDVRVLVAAHPEGVRLVDLSDSEEPGAPVDVPLAIRPVERRTWSSLVLASVPNAPRIVLAAAEAGVVAVIDTRTGDVVSTWRSPALPADVIVGAGSGGKCVAAVLSARLWWRTVPGGRSHLDLLDLSALAPMHAGSVFRAWPEVPDDMAVLEGGVVAIVEGETNSLSWTRPHEGTILGTTGFSQPYFRSARLRSGGRTLLAMDARRYDVFDLHLGRLVLRAGASPDDWVHEGAVLSDGTVVVLTSDTLRSVLPDGTESVFSLPEPGGYRLLSLAASGRRVVVAGVQTAALDLNDPVSPIVLWSSPVQPYTVDFDSCGSRLFVTFDEYFQYSAGLLDAETGAELGPRTGAVPKVAYHGAGVAVGCGPGARGLVWAWTWTEWKTDVFDLSGPTPTVLYTSPEYAADPVFLERPAGGWYEVRSDPFEGNSNVRASRGLDAAGTQIWAAAPPSHWFGFRLGRPGILVGVEGWRDAKRPEIVVWGDPSVISARPVAVGAGGRTGVDR